MEEQLYVWILQCSIIEPYNSLVVTAEDLTSKRIGESGSNPCTTARRDAFVCLVGLNFMSKNADVMDVQAAASETH
jgi:hypothetical protein